MSCLCLDSKTYVLKTERCQKSVILRDFFRVRVPPLDTRRVRHSNGSFLLGRSAPASFPGPWPQPFSISYWSLRSRGTVAVCSNARLVRIARKFAHARLCVLILEMRDSRVNDRGADYVRGTSIYVTVANRHKRGKVIRPVASVRVILELLRKLHLE